MKTALFCSDAADTYQLSVITALSKEARAQGFRPAVFVTNVLPEDEREFYIENQFFGLPSEGLYEGAVVLGDAVTHKASVEEARKVLEPVVGGHWVSVGRMEGHRPVVVIENRKAFRQLLDHLTDDHGYSDFLFLLGPDTSPDAHERNAVIHEFLAIHSSLTHHFLPADFRGDTAQNRVLEYLRSRAVPPRVIVACNDGMALGALAALRELGLRCPEDCAVTGFDDVEVAALEYPSLTTVRQPLGPLASHALTALRTVMQGRPYPLRSETVIPTEMVLRESCGCRPAGKTIADYRLELSRLQSFRAQDAALLTQGSQFSLEMNAALDLKSLLEGLDRFCRALSAGSLTVALVPPEAQVAENWPDQLSQVYRYDGRNGSAEPAWVGLESLFFPEEAETEGRLPLVFMLHTQKRRLGVLVCSFPASWTGFFKLMATNLSTGLSRVGLLDQIQAHSLELEAAVIQRTEELTDAVAALRLEIERRTALERELEREQEALQTILDSQPLPLVILSRKTGETLYFNRSLAQLAGLGGALPPEFGLPLASLEDGSDETYRELRLPNQRGGFFQVMAQKSAMLLRGEPCLIVGMMDLTRQKQLEQDLLTISENERERFGQELHDDVCQQLAALSLYTTALGQKIQNRTGENLEEVKDLSTLIDGILEHVRRLSRGLFPIEVGNQSLEQVFDQLLIRIQQQTGLSFHLNSNLNGRPSGLSPTDDLHLFRILQEAIQNTLKYAKASEVRVGLHRVGRRLTFRFEDDGVGMVPGASEGVGLRSMRYRASQLGARLQVDPGPQGVVLELIVLLSHGGPL